MATNNSKVKQAKNEERAQRFDRFAKGAAVTGTVVGGTVAGFATLGALAGLAEAVRIKVAVALLS